MTFAPKYASSIASLYDSASMTWASGTSRGSALSTPSTSVQITISPASSSEPKIDAEKSLPLRPSVVCRPWVSVAMKPVTTSVPRKSGADLGVQVGARLVPADAGPSGPHSTSSARRASSHWTRPLDWPRRRSSRSKIRVDQISP